MKRLKYLHPFCGKVFPLYLMGGAAIAGMFGCLSNDGEHLTLWIILPVLLAAVGSYVFLHIPDDHDREAKQDASYPLWTPLPGKLLNRIRSMEEGSQMNAPAMVVVALICGVVVFAFTRIPPRGSARCDVPMETSAAIGLIVGSIAFFVILYLQFRSRIWSGIDESAVCTVIPIDHFYDVTHHGRHSETWVTSYIVFYQPDGRYIIRAPEGSGGADSVTVVKYRGMIRCMIVPESDFA
ncbi:MAG: hypothetical protein IK130_11810 [Oscillospiraceae bacterium]|nr:hypothetical protein [Oscillospiraceae bacterium]